MELKQEYEIDKDSYYKAKKYVIKIYPQNIETIDSLEVRERDQFINDAVSVYMNRYDMHQKQIQAIEKIKKTFLYAISTLIIIALLSCIVRSLFIYSDTSNMEMQHNFEKLFQSYNLK